jgi:ElaB/YqjD/DUF883 family membrane-anchored ribosome-binding protein
MEIEKAPKERKRTTKEFLDDHVKQDFGQSLVDSISRLISETKEEGAKKPIKKKKKMSEAQLEQCRKNLARGRETLRKKKQAQAEAKGQLPKAKPKPTPAHKPTPPPTSKPAEPKPKQIPMLPQAEPEPEHLTVKLTDLLV